VIKESPAEAGGLKAGDIIVELAGPPIKESTDLQKRVAAIPPGKPTPLTVLRDRKADKLSIKIGEQPTDDTVVAAVPEGHGARLSVEPLTPDVARTYGLSGRSGVVSPMSPRAARAEAAGIRGGDLILEVNRRPVGSVEEFRKIVGGLKRANPCRPAPARRRRARVRGPQGTPKKP